MPVRHGLLALLAEGPAHGYQLKAEFEARTGGSWELNIGQVYSTLQRLERDELVTTTAVDEGRNVHAITAAGREVLSRWYTQPVLPVPPPRDELAIKVALAASTPPGDRPAGIQRQPTALVEHLQVLTRRKRDLDPGRDLAELIHLDAVLFGTEAQVRWLDLPEPRLAAAGPTDGAAAGGAAGRSTTDHPGDGHRPHPAARAREDLA
jgi:DNA-binding PadR family transcriptional regulator